MAVYRRSGYYRRLCRRRIYNICAAADILKGRYIGADEFSLSSISRIKPVYMELIRNGCAATILGPVQS